MTTTSPPILASIAAVAATTEAWLCDIWGVLHDGAAALPGAAEACAAFRRQGGRVLLVSNAPRPAADVAKQLLGFGIGPASYDGILTSGDVTRGMLDHAPWAGPVLHVGPERHAGLFAGTAASRVSEAEATAVICTGLTEIDPDEQPKAYRVLFARLVKRGLPMLCANPDVRVESGAKLVWCAGALAALYAQLGGRVVHAGKPHAAVYAQARKRLVAMAGRVIPDATLLAVGDGVETDLRGADREGFRSVYIASRIHMAEALTAENAARLFATHRVTPIAAMARLAWG
jgi:HAD superfamily hydrolase (TIGR01459 family)